jgi:signal transduction histidine kinase
MVKLTRTLLEMASASGSKSGLEIKPVRIDEIILRLPPEISKLNQNYSVVIDFNEPPENQDYLIVNGNEELLYTAINNIAVNACKYSRNNEAKIILKADAKKINVHISNNGIGIPENEIENIFQPFYRVENNLSKSGFGLGLSLAKKIINLHEGTIKVESTKNSVTTFSIEFNH